MIAANLPTVARYYWADAIGTVVGRELGRFVVLLGHDFVNLAWGIGRVLALLRHIAPDSLATVVALVRLVGKALRFVGKTYVYATATKAQRGQIKARWHRSTTTRVRVNARTYRPKGARA